MSGRENPLRREAERMLGSKVHQDRGGALFSAAHAGEILPSDWFTVELKDGRARLRPTQMALQAFWTWAAGRIQPEGLGEQLQKLEDRKAPPAELELFTQGVKQMELNAAPMLWLVYDKRLRQLAAEALRSDTGGGLLACWACMALALKR